MEWGEEAVKSAKEWQHEFRSYYRENEIKAIQRDALLHAASLCRSARIEPQYTSPGKLAAALYQGLERAIEAEADKLKP